MTANPPQLPEFIFGALSTPEGRLDQVRTSRLGLHHRGPLPQDPKPGELITIPVTVGGDLAVRALTLFYTNDGSPPDLDCPGVPMSRSQIQWDTLTWSYQEIWSAEIPAQIEGTQIQYLIQGTTLTGEIICCPSPSLSPQVYGFYVDQEEIPDWLREAVIYQIFVDRFAPTPGLDFATPPTRSGFYQGTLMGVISKLDYLQSLGVNCLWLTPIFPSPSHHGYDPIAHDRIEPRLGTEADWLVLITQAHQRGLKVILDYVVNHISSDHPAFRSAQQDPHSPTHSWFRFRQWPDQYDCFFDVPGQPEINSDHPQARAYFINQACHWLQLGADGFRLDYAHGVTHAFWSDFRLATRKHHSSSITIGEITSTPDVIASYQGRMDGCLDFKLLELLRGFFAFGSLTVSQFAQSLEQHFYYFKSGLVLPSFLDNHDMNRFLWLVDGDRRRLQLAALCQFTLPGPPIIYYGTEVGLSQIAPVGPLEESRLPMLWGDEQDQDLLTFYRQLIAWRRDNQEIWSPPQSLLIDDQRGIYGYQVGSYRIILNNTADSITLTLGQSTLALILTSNSSNYWNHSELHLEGFSGEIWQSV